MKLRVLALLAGAALAVLAFILVVDASRAEAAETVVIKEPVDPSKDVIVQGRHANGAHWRRAKPKTEAHVDIADCTKNASWGTAFKGADTDWSPSKWIRVHIVPCGSRYAELSATRANQGPNGILAVTEYRYEWGTGHFTYAHITVNTYYKEDATERRSTAVHEVGHALGLDHRPGNNVSVMQPISGIMFNHPDSHDMDELAEIYNH